MYSQTHLYFYLERLENLYSNFYALDDISDLNTGKLTSKDLLNVIYIWQW